MWRALLRRGWAGIGLLPARRSARLHLHTLAGSGAIPPFEHESRLAVVSRVNDLRDA